MADPSRPITETDLDQASRDLFAGRNRACVLCEKAPPLLAPNQILTREQYAALHTLACPWIRVVAEMEMLRALLRDHAYARNGMCISCNADASLAGEDKVEHTARCQIAPMLGLRVVAS